MNLCSLALIVPLLTDRDCVQAVIGAINSSIHVTLTGLLLMVSIQTVQKHAKYELFVIHFQISHITISFLYNKHHIYTHTFNLNRSFG